MSEATQTDLDAAYDELRRIAGRIVALRNPQVSQPYVQGVVVISEYTSVQLDRDNKAGFSLAAPSEQMLSTTRGLVLMAMEHQSNQGDDDDD